MTEGDTLAIFAAPLIGGVLLGGSLRPPPALLGVLAGAVVGLVLGALRYAKGTRTLRLPVNFTASSAALQHLEELRTQFA